jgi:ribosomal protein S18 acetylase RimI-like enzyme
VKNTVVRRLRPEDADEIRRISSSITRNHDTTDFARIAEEQAKSGEDASFVADLDNRLAGYCISYVLQGGFGIEKSAWLAMLGVDPQFMGQGIGEMLATEAMQYYKARGIKDIYTSVKWDSSDLLSFFKTLGFQRSDFINLHKNLDE